MNKHGADNSNNDDDKNVNHSDDALGDSISSSSSAAASVSSAGLLYSSPLKQNEFVDLVLSSTCKNQREEMNILIVEDNAINIKVIKQCFIQHDFKSLTICVNGQLAVEASLQHRYDVILMDLEMPVKDGLTAAKEIRAMKTI